MLTFDPFLFSDHFLSEDYLLPSQPLVSICAQFLSNTGCGVCPGTTFRGSPGLKNNFSKKIFYDEKRILTKSFYGYNILFMRNDV